MKDYIHSRSTRPISPPLEMRLRSGKKRLDVTVLASIYEDGIAKNLVRLPNGREIEVANHDLYSRRQNAKDL